MSVDASENCLPLGDIHDFSSEEAQQLLSNKFVVIVGDSNFRSVYKDLVYILQTNETLSLQQLQGKGEETFANDERVEYDGPHSGINYREVRQYKTNRHLVRFYFVTRVFSAYMERILNDFKTGLETGLTPDVLIIHSCLWDLNKYHGTPSEEPPLRNALREYRQNLEKLFERLSDILPPSCLVIWNTAMPIKNPRGSLFQEPEENTSSPKDVIEANFYSANMACCYRFDVLDLHYSVRFLEAHHAKDGVHWSSWVHRCISKLLLTHVAEAWGVKLDKRRPPPGPKRNMDFSSPLQPPRHTPRRFLPHANGSLVSPRNDVYFHHNSVNYDCGPADDYEEQGPGPNARYSNAGMCGDGFGYEQGPEPHHGGPTPCSDPIFHQNGGYEHRFVEEQACEWGPWSHPFWPGPDNNPHFHQNNSYDSGFMEQYVHEQGPQSCPGWPSPINDPSFQHNGSYSHGFLEEPADEQGLPLQPGQLLPSNDLSFQEDVSFHEQDVVGSVNAAHFPQPQHRPLPYRENYAYVQRNSWPPDGYRSQQRTWPEMEEIHPNGFSPPSSPPPPPPEPIDHHMARASVYSPRGSPREARGRRRNRFITYRQNSRNNVPYGRPRNGSRNAWRAATRRPPYYS